MKDWAPVIQTALWVGLCGYLIVRYGSYIERTLSTLVSRIEKGAAVKAGPVEVGALTPEQQKEKVGVAVAELVQEEPAIDTSKKQVLANRYVLAEDLALRAIQDEYKVPIRRQVSIGDLRLDGYFESADKSLTFVEVKVADRIASIKSLRLFADRFFRTSAMPIAAPDACLFYVVVFLNPEADIAAQAEKLASVASGLSFRMQIKCYSLAELEERFTKVAS